MESTADDVGSCTSFLKLFIWEVTVAQINALNLVHRFMIWVTLKHYFLLQKQFMYDDPLIEWPVVGGWPPCDLDPMILDDSEGLWHFTNTSFIYNSYTPYYEWMLSLNVWDKMHTEADKLICYVGALIFKKKRKTKQDHVVTVINVCGQN